MPVFTFYQYINMIPDETANFVKRLLSYLYNKDRIDYLQFQIEDKKDRLLYKSLIAYRETNEQNKNVLTANGFNTNISKFEHRDSWISSNIDSSEKAKIFTEYYTVFTPFENVEDYRSLTSEDILSGLYRNFIRSDDYTSFKTFKFFTKYNPDGFFHKIENVGLQKRNEYITKKSKEFNDEFPISVINYYDMAGRLFVFLRGIKDQLNNQFQTDTELVSLSLVLAIFYYDHVSSYGDAFNEKQIIVDYITKQGLTKEKIESALGIHIDPKTLENINPTLVLTEFFKGIKTPNLERKNYSVGQLYSKLISTGFEDRVTIKKILGLCNVTISKVNGFTEELKKQKQFLSNCTIDELYKGLVPNVVSYLKRLAKIYTYLVSKSNTMDKTLVDTSADFYVLAVLLSSYEFKNDYNTFLSETGLTIDKVLEIAKLPEYSVYKSELEKTVADEQGFARFENYITKGINSQARKDAITVASIINNTQNREFTKSTIIQKIYKTATSKKLDDNFNSQKNKYLKKQDDERKSALTEKTLENIPISVYNYLHILCSYYIILHRLNVPSPDLEQLSIIFAASRFDERLEKYLDEMGMDRESIGEAFNLDFGYDDKEFNIDIIVKHFQQYIFDRPNPEITVYSIFENAFNPELTNTINLRRGLDKFGKKPEDFINIEQRIKEYEEELLRQERQEKQEELFDSCDEKAKKIMEDVLAIHEYIASNKTNKITNPADIEELSILIALFINDQDYIPFFAHNGITLDVILAYAGLDKKILEDIKKMNINRDLIIEYEKYLYGSEVTVDDIIVALFDDEVNDSRVLEEMTKNTGNNYAYLQEEVTERKERDLTPDQGIQVLSKEEVTKITEPTFTGIIDYGNSISKHAKYINDALNGLLYADTLEHSLDDINTLIGEVVYTDPDAITKKQSFLSRLFFGEMPTEVAKKIDPEKFSDLQLQVDEQIQTLSKELKDYERIKRYIEAYLRKLTEYLRYLEDFYLNMEMVPAEEPQDELSKFIRNLDETSAREVLFDKIEAFRTTIILMKQELVTVHRAIINHFMTINSLQTSKAAVLPLIATEITLGAGKESEDQALEFTSSLVNLLQNIVNKNTEATERNLEKLKSSSIDAATYESLNKRINLYLDSIERSKNVLELSQPEEQPEEEGPKFKL